MFSPLGGLITLWASALPLNPWLLHLSTLCSVHFWTCAFGALPYFFPSSTSKLPCPKQKPLLSHPNNPLESPSLWTTVTLPAPRLGSRPSGSYPTSSKLPLTCSPWTCLSTGGFLKQTFGHVISWFKIFHWLFKWSIQISQHGYITLMIFLMSTCLLSSTFQI